MISSFSKVLKIGNISNKSFFGITILLSSISIIDVLAIGLVPLILIAFEDESRLPSFLLNSPYYSFENLLIMLVFIFFFKLVFAVITQRFIVKFISNKQADLTISLLKKYLGYDYLTFSKSNPNIFIRNLINSVPLYINQALYPHLKIISELIIIFSIVGAIFFVNWAIPLITISMFIIFGGTFFLLTRNKIKSYGGNMLDAQASMYEVSKKSIEGYEEITTGNLLSVFVNKFKIYANTFTGAGARYYALLIIPRQLMEASFILVFVIGILFATRSGLTFNEIVPIAGAIAVGAIRLIPLIANILNYINDIKFSSSAVEEIAKEVLGTDTPHTSLKYYEEDIEKIEIKDVTFSYNEDKSLLNKVNTIVKKGEVLGIVGPSGCGKSTLTRIILGLINPDKGKILVNDSVLKKGIILSSSILTQNNFIFNGTISENVALENLNNQTDEQKIKYALKSAGLSNFVETLNEKEYTIIGDKGQTISGGQKQRLSISRVIYSDKKLLVLDEPTGSLDEKNAQIIFDSLNILKKDKIVIIVTHDKELSKMCDKLISL